jgi:probable rRNA maturation factor
MSYATIYRTVKHCPFSDRFIERVVSRALLHLRKHSSSISVHVIGDTRMTTLNARYRRVKGTTDVLSFPTQDSPDGFFSSEDRGDIFISYPQIVRQAREHRVSSKEEFTRMLVHGVLHVFGYDHGTPSEQKKMYPLQEKLVKESL